jgi:hypothetical protein
MKPTLLAAVSNPWTYRNIFCTRLLTAVEQEFDPTWVCAEEAIAESIRAARPHAKVATIPFKSLNPASLETLVRQYEGESVVFPHRSRALKLDARWYRSKGRVNRLRQTLRLGRPVRKWTATALRAAMADSHRVLLAEPLAEELRDLLRREKPDLLWLGRTDYEFDQVFQAVAAEAGQRTVTTVLGWDNPSSKRMPTAVSDAYVLWGPCMERDIRPFFEVMGKTPRTHQVGSPQFDIYHDYLTAPPSRESVAQRFGLDPAKPIAFYGASSASAVPREHELVRELVDQSRAVASPELQWLVRLHPADDGRRWNELKALPGVVVEQPRHEASFYQWSPDSDHLVELVHQIGVADAVVNNGSTITLDGCVLGRPVIGVRCEPGGGESRRSEIIFDYHHMAAAVKMEAFPVCTSVKSVCEEIAKALRQPSARRAAARRLVDDVVGPLDGRCAERTVKALRETLAAGRTPVAAGASA